MEVWACQGCERIGTSASDLLRQGCEGKPEQYVPPEKARVEQYGDGWTIWVVPGPVRMVSMDCCGFSFDAGHEDTEGGYTCPCCESDPERGE